MYFMFQIVKAASPVLLQIIVLGAFFMYTTVSYDDTMNSMCKTRG